MENDDASTPASLLCLKSAFTIRTPPNVWLNVYCGGNWWQVLSSLKKDMENDWSAASFQNLSRRCQYILRWMQSEIDDGICIVSCSVTTNVYHQHQHQQKTAVTWTWALGEKCPEEILGIVPLFKIVFGELRTSSQLWPRAKWALRWHACKYIRTPPSLSIIRIPSEIHVFTIFHQPYRIAVGVWKTFYPN